MKKKKVTQGLDIMATAKDRKYVDETRRLYHWYGEPVPVTKMAMFTGVVILILVVAGGLLNL